MSEPFDEFREPTLLDAVHGDERHVSGPEEEDTVNESDSLLDDLVDLADTWLDSLPTEYSGDRDWYEYCLRVLARSAGVNEDITTTEGAALLLDLCAVAAITQEFHYIVDGGGQSGDWQYRAWGDVVDARDPSAAILLGMAVEGQGLSCSMWDAEGTEPHALVKMYVMNAWTRVFESLRRELGEDYFFLGLWGARSGLGDPHAAETWRILNAPTNDALVGWQWLQNNGDLPA